MDCDKFSSRLVPLFTADVASGATITAAIIVISIDASERTILITPFLYPTTANIPRINITPIKSILFPLITSV